MGLIPGLVVVLMRELVVVEGGHPVEVLELRVVVSEFGWSWVWLKSIKHFAVGLSIPCNTILVCFTEW